MKKRSVLAALLLLCLLTSCRKSEATATDLLAMLLALPDTPTVTVYFDGAIPDENGYLSGSDGADLYGGHWPGELCDQFGIALCRDDRVYELHLYHALDAEKAEQIETILRRRQTLLQKKENYLYDPDSPAAGSVIWRQGKWVCLLVTNDNDTVREMLKKRL